MQFKGRMFSILFLLIFRGVWVAYYHQLYHHTININEIIITGVLLIPAWFIGKKYDQASYLQRKLEVRKSELVNEVHNSDLRYRNLVESSPNVIVVYNEEGIVTYVNKKTAQLLGASSDLEVIGKSFFDFIHHDDLDVVKKCTEEAEKQNDSRLAEYKINTLNGEQAIIESILLRITDNNQPALMVVGLDVTKSKEIEKRNEKQEESFKNLVEKMPIGLFVHREDKIIWTNPAGMKMAGIKDEDALKGKSILQFAHPESYDAVKKRIATVNKGMTVQPIELKMMIFDGSERIIEMSGLKSMFNGEEVILTFAVDVTEKKRYFEKIKYKANHDSLTGLPNRYALKSTIENLLISGKQGAVFFLDLDRFKVMNDTFGHSFGDKLLKKVTKRLKTLERDGVLLSRYGGDEFIFLLEGEMSHTYFERMALQVLKMFNDPFILNDHQFHITGSIGVSLFPTDGYDVDILIKNADMAMYAAKGKGKNNIKFFTSDMHQTVQRNLEIENGLRKALKDNEFVLHYQPKVDLLSNKIDGAEALIRWTNPDFRQVGPDQFIPIAEDTGLINQIGYWVMEEACKQTSTWVSRGYKNFRTAINVSIVQLQQKDFTDQIQGLLSKYNLDAKNIEFEITESVTRNDEIVEVLQKINSLNIHLSIDDFGTGYSSLSILKYLPISSIKIDRAFVSDIMSEKESLVKTIIDMGNNLGFQLVAEGIETVEQLSYLKESKCHYGQGYYFSRPLPAQEFEQALDNQFILSKRN